MLVASTLALSLLAGAPPARIAPTCPHPPAFSVAAAVSSADTVWVVGTAACAVCVSSGFLAEVRFAQRSVRRVPVPSANEPDARYGSEGAVGETPDELHDVAVEGKTVVAAGTRYCELPHDPFVVLSTDGGKTFVRHELPVGQVYATEVERVWVDRLGVMVRLEVTGSSTDEKARPECYAVTIEGVKAGACRKPPPVKKARVTVDGTTLRDEQGRRASL